LLTVAMLLAGTALQAQGRAKKPERTLPTEVSWWRGSWSKAIAEARERNVPLLVAVIQDGEDANEALVTQLFKDKAFIVATESVVALVASKEDHGMTRVPVEAGGTLAVCKKFGSVPCGTHQAHEIAMFHEFFVGAIVKTPQVVIARPVKDAEKPLEVVATIVDVYGTSTYTDAIVQAQKLMGPGLTRREFEEAKQTLVRARNHTRMEQYRDALLAANEVAALGGESPVVAQAEDIRRELHAQVELAIGRAETKAAAGQHFEALALLDDIKDSFKDTAPGVHALAAYRQLSRTREGREAVRQLKKQKRFEPDFAKAQDHEKVGEWIDARALYQRIIDRADDLPITGRCRARIDHFIQDAAIAALFEAEADRQFQTAEAHEQAGREGRAKKAYQVLVDTYPETQAAKAARSKL
ncbi:MAG: tetratricopeptide repeat protein, partial [Planctomycetes bacterium]|nr:tetratricopeptide repeat protein [Planctomycetota bacterium]